MLSIHDIALLAVLGILCVALEARNPSMPVCMCMVLNLCLIVVMLPVWRESIRLERENIRGGGGWGGGGGGGGPAGAGAWGLFLGGGVVGWKGL